MEIKTLMDDYWMKYGKCRGADPDIFYPLGKNSELISIAKKICEFCPVINECLEYAIVNRESYGIWGGITEEERRSLVKQIRLGEISLENITRPING